MESKNQNKYGFIAQVLILFAVSILFLMMNVTIFGEEANGLSTMFQIGSKGLAISTLLQFLISSTVIIFFKTLLFSEKIIKTMMTLWRTILFLLSILLSFIMFIIIFDWFPLDNLSAWCGFFIYFGGGFIVSTTFMIVKTKLDSKKYDELLLNYKNQRGDNI